MKEKIGIIAFESEEEFIKTKYLYDNFKDCLRIEGSRPNEKVYINIMRILKKLSNLDERKIYEESST